MPGRHILEGVVVLHEHPAPGAHGAAGVLVPALADDLPWVRRPGGAPAGGGGGYGGSDSPEGGRKAAALGWWREEGGDPEATDARGRFFRRPSIALHHYRGNLCMLYQSLPLSVKLSLSSCYLALTKMQSLCKTLIT